MRNPFEQSIPASETGGEMPRGEKESESPEVENVTEIREHIAERFSRLEELAAQICVESGGTISIAGVAIDQERISPEIAQKIKSLKERASAILGRVARATLKTVGVLIISAGLMGAYATINLEKPERFRNRNRARQELVEKGITSEQRYSAYKLGISEMLYRGVSPLGYQTSVSGEGFMGGFFRFLQKKGIDNTAALQQFIPNLILGRKYRAEKYEEAENAPQRADAIPEKELTPEEKQRLEKLYDEYAQKAYKEAWGSFYDLNPPFNPENQKALDDAWRLYLGMPQQYDSFDISEYKPSIETEDKYYYKINKFWDTFLSQDLEVSEDSLDWKEFDKLTPEEHEEFIRFQDAESGLKGKVELIQKFGRDGKILFQSTHIGEDGGDVMYHYMVSLGKDEKGTYVSYYDKWDLSSFLNENIITRGVGRPFEIYDRMYYNPITFEIIEDSLQ